MLRNLAAVGIDGKNAVDSTASSTGKRINTIEQALGVSGTHVLGGSMLQGLAERGAAKAMPAPT